MSLWLFGMIKLFYFPIVKVISDRIQESMGMVYLPIKIKQMYVNILYMDPMGIEMLFFLKMELCGKKINKDTSPRREKLGFNHKMLFLRLIDLFPKVKRRNHDLSYSFCFININANHLQPIFLSYSNNLCQLPPQKNIPTPS